jgi:type IV secretory pathway TraG/TraD family ATPase VirD4
VSSADGGVGRVADYGLVLVVSLAWLIAGALWLPLFIGARLAGMSIPANPITAVLGLVSGAIPWPGIGATLTLGCELLVVLSLARMAWRYYRSRHRSRVDAAARLLARGSELGEYTETGVAESVARLRPAGAGAHPGEHGMFLGDTVATPWRPMRASWENTFALLAGPRRGKTLCFVVRQLIEAPGPALATSLRRDVHDATVDVRAERGTIWNFDPQRLIGGGEPTFWVDLLGEVHSIDDARKLKDHFVSGTRGPNATTSAYFDGEGEQLLSRLFLAAALTSDHTVLHAYTWVTDPGTCEPVKLLRNAGQHQAAAGLNRLRQLPDKQRDGVYGSAAALLNCLENPETNRWVTPPPAGSDLPRFDPDAFVRSRDTLYLHSQEGEGNLSPLIAALTQNVFDAGLRRARNCAGGRLDPPLLSILDEAANVCKIKNLPALYSYLGGSGLPVMTILQSFEQGVDVWGRSGMKKLFDAATVRIYAGGLADNELLRTFSELVGDWDRPTASQSYDHTGRRSTSYQSHREPILEPSELAALPRGRAVVFAAGARPVIIEPQAWMDTAYAPKIRASIAAHDPGSRS